MDFARESNGKNVEGILGPTTSRQYHEILERRPDRVGMQQAGNSTCRVLHLALFTWGEAMRGVIRASKRKMARPEASGRAIVRGQSDG